MSEPAQAALSGPRIRIRGRSLMALVVTPEFPMAGWFEGLDRQMQASGLLAERPIVADLAAALAASGPESAAIVLEGLEARGLRLVGVEGVPPAVLAGTRWAGLAHNASGRPARDLPAPADAPAVRPSPAVADAGAAPCLTIDRPVRSGQTIVFDQGDVTIIGGVASGAEVLAGGSIHVYGTLRGRAIAGVRIGEAGRIFCRRLEAEMVGVGRHFRTAEDSGLGGWGAGLQGCAVQVWCDRGALRLSALD